MVLPTTGVISAEQINIELGKAGTTLLSLNDNSVRSLAQKTSGTIAFADFRGKSSVPQISGLGLWLDASDTSTLILSSNKAQTWKDKTSNGRDFGTASGYTQPTYEATNFNGKASLVFQPSFCLSRLTNTMGTLATNNTISIFIVAEPSSAPWSIVFTNFFNTTYQNSLLRFHLSFKNNTSNALTLGIQGSYTPSFFSSATGTRNVIGVVISPTVNTSSVIFTWNGLTSGTANELMPSYSGQTTSTVYIGDGRAINQATSRVAEIMMYDRNLNSQEISEVTDYLMSKWNIQRSSRVYTVRIQNNTYGTNSLLTFDANTGHGVFRTTSTSITIGNRAPNIYIWTHNLGTTNNLMLYVNSSFKGYLPIRYTHANTDNVQIYAATGGTLNDVIITATGILFNINIVNKTYAANVPVEFTVSSAAGTIFTASANGDAVCNQAGTYKWTHNLGTENNLYLYVNNNTMGYLPYTYTFNVGDVARIYAVQGGIINNATLSVFD